MGHFIKKEIDIDNVRLSDISGLARLTSSKHEGRPDLHSHKDIRCYSVNVMDKERERVHYTVVGNLVIPKVFPGGV